MKPRKFVSLLVSSCLILSSAQPALSQHLAPTSAPAVKFTGGLKFSAPLNPAQAFPPIAPINAAGTPSLNTPASPIVTALPQRIPAAENTLTKTRPPAIGASLIRKTPPLEKRQLTDTDKDGDADRRWSDFFDQAVKPTDERNFSAPERSSLPPALARDPSQTPRSTGRALKATLLLAGASLAAASAPAHAAILQAAPMAPNLATDGPLRLLAIVLPLAAVGLWGLIKTWSRGALEGQKSTDAHQPVPRHYLTNLAFGLLGVAAVTLVMGPSLSAVNYFIQAHGVGLMHWLHIGGWTNVAITFVALDLMGYWWHRLGHSTRLLWRLHRIHHSDLDMDLSTTYRTHPLELAGQLLARMALCVLLGPTLPAIAFYEIWLILFSQYQHSNIKLPARLNSLLSLAFATSQMHNTHHSNRGKELNSNFSGTLSLWDRIFGTYHPGSSEKIEFGLKGYDEPLTFRALMMMPFRPNLSPEKLRLKFGREAPRAAGSHLAQIKHAMRDLLGYLAHAADAPDAKAAGLVRLQPLPFQDMYLVTNPALIHQIVMADSTKFVRSKAGGIVLRRFFGRSLLTTEGEDHHTIRLEVQGAFKPKASREHLPEIRELSRQRAEAWRPAAAIDVSSEMHELALQIFARSYFGITDNAENDRVLKAMRGLADELASSLREIPMPAWIPSKRNRKQVRVKAEIDAELYRMIDERTARPNEKPTLLDQLIAAEPMTPERKKLIADQLTALFFAGHETSANLLAWTFHLLSEHPEVERKLRAEISHVVGDRPLAPEDLDHLPYLKMVVNEVMRLYPPGWILEREAVEDTILGGYRIPRGKQIFTPIFLMHRNPAFFARPDDFLPERFSDEQASAKRACKDAHMPFGGGPHYCLGHSFALDSVQGVIVTILQRWRLSRIPGDVKPVPAPGASLGIEGGLRMIVEPVSPPGPAATELPIARIPS